MPNYFSQRDGVRKRFGLAELRQQFYGMYRMFEGAGYFAEWLGYRCVDGRDARDWVMGKGGNDLASFFYASTSRNDLFPIDPLGESSGKPPWTEDQLFDAFQFLASIISKPTSKRHHDFGNCGDHFGNFVHHLAVAEYRTKVNEILGNYGDSAGWTLGPEPDLVIHALAPTGLEPLFTAPKTEGLDEESRRRVRAAVDSFRARNATIDTKRAAVRDLGDVLEKFRAEVKAEFTNATESNLFNLLNNFGLRHNNASQQSDYDAIYMDGTFYHQLNLIHVMAHILRLRTPPRDRLAALRNIWPT